jgi:aspartyl-tRNA(Asn)/glutamyl-tRNA(Gln) amidotransferase subunit B
MRFEPNINVHITDGEGKIHKTAITEIKNLNSFSVLERATAYEIQRQIREWVDTGELGKKSTYGWDEPTESTFFQRFKEGESDYRYFPDPDLVPVEVDEAWLAQIKSQVGEMPAVRRQRYIDALGLSPADAATLAGDRATGDYYEHALRSGGDPKRVSNLILSHGRRLCNEKGCVLNELGILPERVAEIAKLIDAAKVAPSAVGPIFDKLMEEDAPAEGVARSLGLIQQSDTGAIDAAIDAMIAQNPPALADFKAGRQQAMGALVGMVMKSAKGLNPKLVQERLRAKLS